MPQVLTKEDLKSLVASGDTEKAIDLILNFPFLSPLFKNEVVLISNRFENNQKYFRLGIKKGDDINVENNSINYSLIEIIDKLNINEGVRNVETLKKEIDILKKEITLLRLNLNAKELLISNPIFNSFPSSGTSWKINTNALLIGLDEYQKDNIRRLYGAVNDVELFMETLNYRNFFFRDEVIRMKNEEATKRNILEAWEYLTNKSKENENLIFFFSGHCWDENLVCYDSKSGTEDVIPFSIILDLCIFSNYNVLIILDTYLSLSDTNFSKLKESKVAILMASNGEFPPKESPSKNGVNGIFSIHLREIFAMHKGEIPIVLIESLLLMFHQSIKAEGIKIPKPFFLCGYNFNMIFPENKFVLRTSLPR